LLGWVLAGDVAVEEAELTERADRVVVRVGVAVRGVLLTTEAAVVALPLAPTVVQGPLVVVTEGAPGFYRDSDKHQVRREGAQ
jgi:hypothetical protein